MTMTEALVIVAFDDGNGKVMQPTTLVWGVALYVLNHVPYCCFIFCSLSRYFYRHQASSVTLRTTPETS